MNDATHFERLGLPRRFAIDAATIEREYLARSRELHPDYHQLSSAAEQRASLELSSALNEANAVLRDPFRRAEYLLMLEGGPSASEMNAMPQAFLMDMLDLREQVAMLQAAKSPELIELEQQLNDHRSAFLMDVSQQFAKLESTSDEAERLEIRKAIRSKLNMTKYINGLIRDSRS